jgi:hypothetical protein
MNETVEIPLTQGKTALIDAADLGLVSQYRWHASRAGNTFYVQSWTPTRNGKRRRLLLHRLVLNAARGSKVDHENGNGLDNRRANLRIATDSQNQANSRKRAGTTSLYKGVSWWCGPQKWVAEIQAGNPPRRIYLGRFNDESEAARAYDVAAKRLFGAFAKLNFPEGSPCDQVH